MGSPRAVKNCAFDIGLFYSVLRMGEINVLLCKTPSRKPTRADSTLSHRVFYFAQPVGTLEHFARLRTIGCAYDAVSLHQIDEVRGAPVADPQAPLQQRGRSLAVFQHDAHCVLVKLVMVVVALAVGIRRSAAVFGILARSLQEVLLILRFGLRAPEPDDGCNLFLRGGGGVRAVRARGSVGGV